MAETARLDIDGRRHYRNPYLDGRPTPSVTTILDDVLVKDWSNWSANMAVDYVLKHINEKKSKAQLKREAVAAPGNYYSLQADIGTGLHDIAESGATEDVVLDPEETIPELAVANESWMSFKEDFPHTFIDSKVEVFGVIESPRLPMQMGFGGTYDYRCLLGDKKVILDFKTSREIQLKHALQLAAYWVGAKNAGIEIDEGWILHLGKNFVFYDPIEIDLEWAYLGFCLMVEAYYLKHSEELVWRR